MLNSLGNGDAKRDGEGKHIFQAVARAERRGVQKLVGEVGDVIGK